MLGLKLPTDPRWVNIVEKNISEILTDHAYCEQKAASTAISLIISFPEKEELVSEMIDLAQEEMSHFKMVHQLIKERGYTLGKERPDYYVRDLLTFFPKGGSREIHLVHRLLYAGLIEARSCERFRLLSEHLSDLKLRTFYKNISHLDLKRSLGMRQMTRARLYQQEFTFIVLKLEGFCKLGK